MEWTCWYNENIHPPLLPPSLPGLMHQSFNQFSLNQSTVFSFTPEVSRTYNWPIFSADDLPLLKHDSSHDSHVISRLLLSLSLFLSLSLSLSLSSSLSFQPVMLYEYGCAASWRGGGSLCVQKEIQCLDLETSGDCESTIGRAYYYFPLHIQVI